MEFAASSSSASAMDHIDVLRTTHPQWLSNAYLVVNRSQQSGVLIDGNGVPDPLLERVDREGIDVTAILLTHHHADHVELNAYDRFDAPILAHPETAQLAGLSRVDQSLVDGEVISTAGLRIEVLYTPGHARDHVAFLIDKRHCFTADLIFRGTIGGTRGPGGTDLSDLRRSIDRVLALPPATKLHPGHCESTTVADELATNPFLLAWRAGDTLTPEPCTVAGEPAELILWGPDYDGTHKAWVRLADGVHHIVGGSVVTRGTPQASQERLSR